MKTIKIILSIIGIVVLLPEDINPIIYFIAFTFFLFVACLLIFDFDLGLEQPYNVSEDRPIYNPHDDPVVQEMLKAEGIFDDDYYEENYLSREVENSKNIIETRFK